MPPSVAREFDFAMLNITVGRETSFDLSRRLRSAGVFYCLPLARRQVALDSDHSASITIQKPYERAPTCGARFSR
jgi:hypothetical protein